MLGEHRARRSLAARGCELNPRLGDGLNEKRAQAWNEGAAPRLGDHPRRRSRSGSARPDRSRQARGDATHRGSTKCQSRSRERRECRSCGARGRAVVSVKSGRQEGFEPGCSLRQHKARLDAGRRCKRVGGLVVRAIARRPRPARRQPARWLPRPRATAATRWSKTRHPTNDWGCVPRSIEPLTVDPRSRRPLTLLCCPPVPP